MLHIIISSLFSLIFHFFVLNFFQVTKNSITVGILNLDLSRFQMVGKSWVANGPDFEWDLKIGIQPFEMQTNSRHFLKNHLKFGQKHPDCVWSSYQMFGTIANAKAKALPFENLTI